jgi:hypothetical protein
MFGLVVDEFDGLCTGMKCKLISLSTFEYKMYEFNSTLDM